MVSFGAGEMLTDGVNDGFTVKCKVLDVALEGEAQPVEEVNKQTTES